ncbi:ABC-2 type transport system ATP-binding protein [Haloactinopolyspora alba]|uniref:ABC-2 type transport system ATP-binding protein n=1 Tax=Haloactinopolyspora alba TaxID=648780 RepID=A0A2P8DWP2_9ACTN|nr:ABC transporter ATP-binding protein [Haloactinopolyspora alba]PSL01630.1 ABC-2 type transport system ATP-binding protein [Haloactinopolyspora alba]
MSIDVGALAPSPPDTPAVHVAGVSKSFGTLPALSDVDLRVQRGQVYGVLGPNGAGKTTLLRILLGLVHADTGTVRVSGRHPGAPEALRGIGALIETPAFVPHLSGRTNLRVLARARGLPDSEVQRVLEIVQLDGRADDRYGGYSLGMGQRLGVAAALLGRPPLLVLDEPTNGLDPDGVVQMRELVRNLGTDGTTVLLSSHILGEVQQICERVVVLDRGRTIADDTVENLRAGPGALTVELRADPPAPARTIARSRFGEATVPESDDATLRLHVDPGDVPALVRALVEGGVDVHEVRHERQSLEDVFFELTRHDAAEVRS